uniref:Endonuclease-reverse transcriptase n=1 Tax=Caenorhabditis japonica TaxID=281687 RepID=A0A8R1IF17_CAEJA
MNNFISVDFYYRVRVTHAALERRLVGISLSEQRQRNLHREDIRAQSEVRDPLLVIKKKKLGWAGHIMRRNDGRWTRLVQEWYPIGEKRPVGRPRMRWSDSLKEEISLFDGNHLKTHWSTIAKDRMAWKAVIRDHIREDIRAQSEVRDPLLVIKKKKLGWAGHIMRRNDGRWTRLVQEWYPIGEKRPVGRPRMRWSDSLKEEISLFDGNHLKTHWSTIAKDRMAWKAVIRDHIRSSTINNEVRTTLVKGPMFIEEYAHNLPNEMIPIN